MFARNFLMLVLALSFFAGCSPASRQYALDSAILAASVSDMADEYAIVERAIRAKKSVFTDEEWRELELADATFDLAITRLNSVLALNIDAVDIRDVDYIRALVSDGYRKARSVIYGRWSQFDNPTQILLNRFDAKAQYIDQEIAELLASPTSDRVNKALSLITGLISMASKILTSGAF